MTSMKREPLSQNKDMSEFFLTCHFILCETDQRSTHVKPMIVAVFQRAGARTCTRAHTHTRKWKGMSGEMHLEWMR